MKVVKYWKRLCGALREPCEMLITVLLVMVGWLIYLHYDITRGY